LDAAKAELRARGVAFEERDYGVAWSIYVPTPTAPWSRSRPARWPGP